MVSTVLLQAYTASQAQSRLYAQISWTWARKERGQSRERLLADSCIIYPSRSLEKFAVPFLSTVQIIASRQVIESCDHYFPFGDD